MWAGERTCRENWRLSHGVRGGCVQEEAGINCKKQVETHWTWFFIYFFGQHSIKMKAASTHFSSASQAEKPSALSIAHKTLSYKSSRMGRDIINL